MPGKYTTPRHLSLIIFYALSLLLMMGGCAKNPAAKEARFLQRGKALLEKKEYSRASLEFRDAVQAMPRDAEAHYQLALAYIGMRDVQAAVKSLKTTISLSPNHSGAQLKLAAFEFGSPNMAAIDDAGKRVRDVLAAHPDDPDALEMLAVDDLRLGKWEDALEHFQESLDKSPKNLQTALNFAKLELAHHNPAGAEAILKKAAQSSPQAPEPALALAGFYRANGNKAGSENQLHRALQLSPKNPTALLMLAAVQMESGQPGEAELTYRQLSALPDASLQPLHAIFLYQQGKRDGGIAELAQLNARNPNDRNLRAILVSMYVSANRENDAQRILNDALKRNPKDIDALLDRSRFFLASGRFTEVEADLQLVLHFRPESAVAHYGLAIAYGARGLASRQLQELNDAVRFNPLLLSARTDLVRALLKTNGGQAALDILNKAPEDQKRNPAWIVSRNWVFLAQGDVDALHKSVDEGLALSHTPALLYQQALVRLNQKDFNGARSVLEQLMAAYPESVSALDLLGETYAAQRNLSRALEVVEDYAAKRPKSAYLRYVVGLWQTRAHDYAKAREAFAEAVRENPGFVAPALLLSEMNLSDGNLDAARATLKDVLSRKPENTRAIYLLGLVQERSGDRASAIASYRAVVEADPTNGDALNNLAYNLADAQPDAALSFAQKAVELGPDNPAAKDTLGWIYYKKRDYTVALSYFETAVRKEATAARRYHLGLTYAKLGEQSLAAQNLAEALKMDPKLPVNPADFSTNGVNR